MSHAVEVRSHGNTSWLLGDDLFHSLVGDKVFLEAAAVIELFGSVRFFAGSLLAKVVMSVILPEDDSMVLCPVVGIEHPATFAAPVDIVTVHQVLDRVHWYFRQVVYDGIQRLKSRCCRERPACTAAMLVDRRRDFACLEPVYVLREVRLLEDVLSRCTDLRSWEHAWLANSRWIILHLLNFDLLGSSQSSA